MTQTSRTLSTATPLYPGSFVAEEGRPVEIADTDPQTALAAAPDDGRWFALQVTTTKQKRWDDGAGEVMWTPFGKSGGYRIYVGEVLTASDIEQWPDADRYRILLSNMRGNGWDRVVRTRQGNFQPVEDDDVVISDAELLEGKP